MRNHKLFYGSSYDRGLDILLKLWPQIIEKFPDATLDVCYGWDLFDRGYANNPERMAWKERLNQQMTLKGITHHGRLGKQELAKVRRECGVWAYPTYFPEINCITALDSQRDGLVPVTMNFAALKETVGAGVKIEGDIYDDETQEAYLQALFNVMEDNTFWEKESNKARAFAKGYSWDKIAPEWEKHFKRTGADDVLDLIYRDEPLAALKLARQTNQTELITKLETKLAHVLDPKKYKAKYASDPMKWRPPGIMDLSKGEGYDRHNWIWQEILRDEAHSLIDLGCYEGDLVLSTAKHLGIKATGVELCKAAVECAQDKAKSHGVTAEFVQGDVETYRSTDKYDAVVCCETIEHLPDPAKLIETMQSLVSPTGWMYLTTPDGPFDTSVTRKTWLSDGDVFDHVRAYTQETMNQLLAGYQVQYFKNNEKLLYVKFRKQ